MMKNASGLVSPCVSTRWQNITNQFYSIIYHRELFRNSTCMTSITPVDNVWHDIQIEEKWWICKKGFTDPAEVWPFNTFSTCHSLRIISHAKTVKLPDLRLFKGWKRINMSETLPFIQCETQFCLLYYIMGTTLTTLWFVLWFFIYSFEHLHICEPCVTFCNNRMWG